MASALEHLRVVDFSDGIAGAYCTKLLAGFGADVIKVEPAAGEALRHRGPFAAGTPGVERSLPFQWLNTAKRSVILDLGEPGGRELARRLAARADVVIESFAPRRAAALGLDYDSLRALRADLVVTSVTPFGQSGPYRDYAASEATLYAMAGLMNGTGDGDREPLNAGPAIASLSAGMKAYVATLMACLHRDRSGGGEHVDVSIHEAALDNIEIAMAEYLHLGKVHRRNGDEHALVPWRIFPCRDGHAAIIGGPIRHWLAGAALFESAELVSDELDHMARRIANRERVRELMAPWLARHDKEEIYHAGQARKLAFAYLASLAEVFASPQLAARGYLQAVEHPQLGELPMPAAPFRGPGVPWSHTRAPLLGEHTAAVLDELASTGASAPAPRPRGRGPDAAAQPLAGVRIVDLTHDWAGPHATRVMADYGAEVIKIEYPRRLCGMRGAYLDRRNGHPRWWEINRNKRSITLDLHRPEHVAAVEGLVAEADVVVDNSRPGVLEGFGLGYERLRTLKPDIILVAMSAYGATGPESRYAGYGGAIEALSGVQSLTAYDAAGDRMRVREVDVTNGIMGACAVVTALAARQRSGHGQYIDLAQREASGWLIGEHLLEHAVNGEQTLPLGNRDHEYTQGCYACRGEDRWLVVTVRDDEEWRRLCTAIGVEADAALASAAGRRANGEAVDGLIGAWCAGRDAREAMEALQAAGIAAGVATSTADLAGDPHLAERGWFVESAAEGGRYPGFPFRFRHACGGVLHRRGPDLGADNHVVLCGRLGWSEAMLPSLAEEDLGTSFDIE